MVLADAVATTKSIVVSATIPNRPRHNLLWTLARIISLH
jgi:hypothetical protein